VNILGEKRQFFELTTKKGRQNICLENLTFYQKIGWSWKFRRPDSRPPDFGPGWRRWMKRSYLAVRLFSS